MSRSRPGKREPQPISAELLRGWPLPVPAQSGKDARGAILVVAGCPQMPGAAILAATAALRAGAGKLSIATCRSIAPHVAAAVPESLTAGVEETRDGAIALGAINQIAELAKRANAMVIGPGFTQGRACNAFVRAILRATEIPVVLDAAALGCLRRAPRLLEGLDGNCVLTPHAGEMSVLLGRDRDVIESAPIDAVREASQRFSAVVALKGAQTYIAAPPVRCT